MDGVDFEDNSFLIDYSYPNVKMHIGIFFHCIIEGGMTGTSFLKIYAIHIGHSVPPPPPLCSSKSSLTSRLHSTLVLLDQVLPAMHSVNSD